MNDTFQIQEDKLGEIKFENKPSTFSTFLLDIDKLMEEGLTSVFGLEDIGGYGRALTQLLTDHGQVVKEVNPTDEMLLRDVK